MKLTLEESMSFLPQPFLVCKAINVVRGVDFSKDILEFGMFSRINKGLKNLETIIKVEVSAQIEYLGAPLGNDYFYMLC
jgi:hypothetical protein